VVFASPTCRRQVQLAPLSKKNLIIIIDKS